MNGAYDVIVVGSGAMGSACCWQLAASGLKVLGLDSHHPPHDKGSSHGANRIIRQAYFEDARYIPFCKRSYQLWDQLEQASSQRLFHRNGLLVMGSGDQAIPNAILKNGSEHNVQLQQLSAAEISSAYPQFLLSESHWGVMEENAGFLEVENCVAAQVKVASELGAEFKFGEPISSWSQEGNAVSVTTTIGQYHASHLVIACGAWSSEFLADCGVPLVVRRVPQFWFSVGSGYKENDGMPCFAFTNGPEFIYGFPQLGEDGLKVAQYEPSDVVKNPNALDTNASEADLAPVATCVTKHLAGLKSSRPVRVKMCMYTLTPDRNFLMGRHPKYSRLIVATGGSGHAFKMVPFIGEQVKNLITDTQTEFDIGFLGFSRG